MSIVCCKILEDRIEIASDSIMVQGYTQEKGKDNYSKLSSVNGMVIGSCGTASESGLMQVFALTHKPAYSNEDGILNFITEFCEWKKLKTGEFKLENHYIIAFDSKVFYIENYFVKEVVSYEAVGAGREFALAVLYLGNDVEQAVSVSCELCIYCEKPIKKFVIPIN